MNVNRTLCRLVVLIGLCFLMSCLITTAQVQNSRVFALTDGQHEMRATYKFSDQEDPVVNVGGVVTVTIKGDELSIVVPISPTPIVAKITGNSFKGHLQSGGVSIEFLGEIVEDNHVEGVFLGSFGARKVNGLWTMKVSKKKQEKIGT